MKKDSAIRQFCIHVSSMRKYNWVIVILICISTALAMWADKANRAAHPKWVALVIEPIQTILLIVYWLDVLVHMVADGVCMLPKSYLRNAWNVLDISLLIGQVVVMVMEFAQDGEQYTSYMRVMRTLRSLRIVYYVQGMRVIFLDLLYGFPKMLDAVALNILVFVPFAIYGCYIFSGKFKLCNDSDSESISMCFGEFKSEDEENTDILLPRVWKNPYDYSYDTFGAALLHLFECASGEGWVMFFYIHI